MTESRIFYVALAVAIVVFGLIHLLPFPGSVPHFVHSTAGGPSSILRF